MLKTFLSLVFLLAACQASPLQDVPTRTYETSSFEKVVVEDILLNEAVGDTSNRQDWYDLIKWSDTCENSWQQFENDGLTSVHFSTFDNQKYVILVICNFGPNWIGHELYLLDLNTKPLNIQQLSLKAVYLDDDGVLAEFNMYALDGYLQFSPKSRTLTYQYKGGGLPACQHFYKYKFVRDGFDLQEARELKCDDARSLRPEEWDKIYLVE